VWIEIMGSYRRGQENSGDVDILITRDTEDGGSHAGVLRGLVGRLVEQGIITHQVG
jgi:DNA polymerase lambda